MGEMRKAWELEPGDHFIGWGPGWIVAKPSEYVGTGDIGSDRDRHREVVTFVNVETLATRTLPMNGNSRANVIPGWAEANGVSIPEGAGR